MKKHLHSLLLMFVCTSSLLIGSCNKEAAVVAQQSIETRLANDPVFKNTLTAAADLGMNLNIESLSKESNIADLKSIAERINNKTATAQDYARIKEITGVSYADFIAQLQKFALSLNDLNKKYPELSKMKQAELSSTVTKAIQLNPALQSFVNNPTGKALKVAACPLRDICNLAVVLVKLFGGDAICTAISVSTIPVIGGILCQLILSVGVSILVGICNALPC
ncbi:MAG: hypothetical protein JWN78_934 [Bacteroidota bacterium]|nr:hypothetical protein [Bacteroidota bacterium]